MDTAFNQKDIACYQTVDGVEWQVRGEYLDSLRSFSIPKACLEGKCIKSSPVRSVLSVKAGEVECILKIFHANLITDQLRVLLFPRALIEWNHLAELYKSEIPVPEPVAVGKKDMEAYLLIRKIPDVKSLKDVCFEPLSCTQKNGIIVRLASLMASLHNHSFVHNDLHFGNLLVNREGLVFLVDLYEIEHPVFMNKNKCIANVAMFGSSFSRVANYTDYLRFWKEYTARCTFFQAYDIHIPDAKNDIALIQNMLQRRQDAIWEKKTGRCLDDNKYFHRLEIPDGKGIIGNENSQLVPILQDVDKMVSSSEIIKDSRTTLVARTHCGILKLYRRKKWRNLLIDCLRKSRAKRAWIAGHRCMTREIPTAKPLAFWEKRTFFSFLSKSAIVTEEIKDSQTLSQYLVSLPTPASGEAFLEKKRLMHKIGNLIHLLHLRGLSHRDLKSSNLLVDKKHKIYLIDMDGLQFKRRLSKRRMYKDVSRLVQSLKKIPGITWTDIWRLLDGYMPFKTRREQASWMKWS